jgi:hypothetical protein
LSWVQNRRVSLRCLVAAVLLASAGVAAADILVVRSTGPSAKSFPPGKRLPETARITLKPNDQLTVLDGRGTRILRGPGTFTAGAQAGGTRSASAAPGLTDRRARIGASRGPGEELRPPSIWHVDVSRSSTVCVADVANLTLWRPDSAKRLTLVITRLGDGATRKLAWEAGESTIAWPAAFAPADGAGFRLSAGGGKSPTSLTFRRLPQMPSGLEDTASAMIRNDCNAQLDLLIETVRLPEDKAPGS